MSLTMIFAFAACGSKDNSEGSLIPTVKDSLQAFEGDITVNWEDISTEIEAAVNSAEEHFENVETWTFDKSKDLVVSVEKPLSEIFEGVTNDNLASAIKAYKIAHEIECVANRAVENDLYDATEKDSALVDFAKNAKAMVMHYFNGTKDLPAYGETVNGVSNGLTDLKSWTQNDWEVLAALFWEQ